MSAIMALCWQSLHALCEAGILIQRSFRRVPSCWTFLPCFALIGEGARGSFFWELLPTLGRCLALHMFFACVHQLVV